MKQLRTIVTIVIVIAAVALGVVFALSNKEPVPLSLIIFSFEPRSLALWLVLAFVSGGVAGVLVSSLYLVRSRAALGSARRQLTRARSELQQVRTAHSPGTELKGSE